MIDVSYDFRTDAGGKDPDSHSPRLLSGGSSVVFPFMMLILGPVSSVWPKFTPATPGPTFRPGDYVCRISLDGVAVAEKRFSIAGSARV